MVPQVELAMTLELVISMRPLQPCSLAANPCGPVSKVSWLWDHPLPFPSMAQRLRHHQVSDRTLIGLL